MTILLVEDDEMTREGLVAAFSEEGWQVLACASVAQVREVLAGEMPALAVVDMQLADGDGFEVAALVASGGVFAVTWGITKLAGRKWRTHNIIDQIRVLR